MNYDNATLLKHFQLSANMVTHLKSQPTNDEKLVLYGLYKQSNIGNCNIEKPNNILHPVDYAKYKAWMNVKDVDKIKAMNIYIDIVDKLIDKYGVK